MAKKKEIRYRCDEADEAFEEQAEALAEAYAYLDTLDPDEETPATYTAFLDEWADQTTYKFAEERPERRVMELEFLLDVLATGTSEQRLYAGLLAASLINDYPAGYLGRYPVYLREAGVELKLDPRPVTQKQGA